MLSRGVCMHESRNLTHIQGRQIVPGGYIGQAIHARRPHGNFRAEVNCKAATGQGWRSVSQYSGALAPPGAGSQSFR
jgi:hypothetical protein